MRSPVDDRPNDNAVAAPTGAHAARIFGLVLATLVLAGGVLALTTAPAGQPSGPAAASPVGDGSGPGPGATSSPQPAAPAEAPGPAPRAPVPDRLAALVAADDLRARTFGVSVTTADGTEVFGHSGDAGLLPASSQKLLVAAAALVTLGPEFRYETELRGAPPDAEGVVRGDVVLVGSGDPTLGTPLYHGLVPERPRAPLEALADQVVASGVRRVTGGVVGDPRVFPQEPVAPGWTARYLERGHTVRSSGLTADGGRWLFAERGRMRSEPSVDPASTAAASLHTLLVERGVDVAGSAASTTAPSAAPARLASVHSPPLRELLRSTVQRSDNQIADAIFRTIGLAHGDASWAGSARATRQALAGIGLDVSSVSIVDGSGLSRDNRLSPSFLTALDVTMSRSSHGVLWRALMAVAGERGTLQRRLVGTVADGRLLGKTGSLVDVGSLSGRVEGPAGSRYHFAVIGNELDAAGQAALRRLEDLLVLVLAEDLHDCSWEATPAGERELRCAG